MQTKRMEDMQNEIDKLRQALDKAGMEVEIATPVEKKQQVPEDEDPSMKYFRKGLAISQKPSTKKMNDSAGMKLLLEMLQAKAKADKTDEREGNEKDTMQEFIAEFFIGKFGKGGTIWVEKCGSLMKTLHDNGIEAERAVAEASGSSQNKNYFKQLQRIVAQMLCLYRDPGGDTVHQVNERYEHFLANGVGQVGIVKKGGKGSVGNFDGMKALGILNKGCESLSTDENLQMNYILRLDAMLKMPEGETRKANSLAGTSIDVTDFIWLYGTMYQEATKTGNVNQKRRRNSTAGAMAAARRMSQQGIGPETM